MRPALITLVAAIAVIGTGCGAVGQLKASQGNAARGKALFEKATLTNGPGCGSCHTLADAGTQGTVGPNLDDAFRYDKLQGFKLSTIRDVVRGQIAYATANTGTGNPGMPDNIVRGQDAKDIAVYVAQCSAVPNCGVTAASG